MARMTNTLKLQDQLLQIARAIEELGADLVNCPQLDQRAALIGAAERASSAISAVTNQLCVPGVSPPLERQAIPGSAPGMVRCPHCEAEVKCENIERHVRKVHRLPARAAPIEPRPAPPGKLARPLRVAIEPSGPARKAARAPKTPRNAPPPRSSPLAPAPPRMEELAASETLRKITLELELLNRDLYRED